MSRITTMSLLIATALLAGCSNKSSKSAEELQAAAEQTEQVNACPMCMGVGITFNGMPAHSINPAGSMGMPCAPCVFCGGTGRTN